MRMEFDCNTDENDWNFWTDRKCIEYGCVTWLFFCWWSKPLLLLLPLPNTKYVGHSDRNKWMFFFCCSSQIFIRFVFVFFLLIFFRLSFNARHAIVILDRRDHSKCYCLFGFSHPSRRLFQYIFCSFALSPIHGPFISLTLPLPPPSRSYFLIQ